MTDPKSNSRTNPARSGSKAKKASAASLGATVLLVIAYLIASWLGIPLDGLFSAGGDAKPNPPRPVAVATDSQATADSPAASTSDLVGAESSADTSSGQFQIENVTVHNLDGEIAFRGTVDLTETMRRIDAGRRLEFRNDGSTFQNRERRLPNKPRGYYREFVHPTPKLRGPGPQRVVTGKEGEAYYTFDHYKTFQRIR